MSSEDHPGVDAVSTVDLGVTNLQHADLVARSVKTAELVAASIKHGVIARIDPSISPAAPKRLAPTFVYAGTVVRWVDGDTVDVAVDLGFRLTTKQRVRVYGLDTPERGHPLHDAAWERSRALAPEGGPVTLRTHKDDLDKYGRWLAEVQSSTCADVTAALIAEGLGKPYDGGTKTAW